MADYKIVDFIGAPMPVSITGTFATSAGVVPPFPFGLEVRAVDRGTASSLVGAGRFIFCQGSNVASVGQFVQIQNGSAVLLASANSSLRYQVGVCPGVLSATNVWGWVQVQGVADYCRANASDVTVAAGVGAYLCATAGAVNPTVGVGSRVRGLHAPVSNASGTANSAAHKYYLDGACEVHGLTASQ